MCIRDRLRRVLGKHVTQKGSFVGPDRLRFDFSHMKPINENEKNKIEDYVNSMVKTKADVKTRIMTPKEATNSGALALFGEKYGDEVRVLSMGMDKNNYFSTELCGGTHVRNISEIGKFKIVNQSAIAAGVRRVEALRDKQLEDYEKFLKKDKTLKEKTLKQKSFLIVGLDPDLKKIPVKNIFEFNKEIIDKTYDIVVGYKPQLAFYEAQGIEGMKMLAKTIEYIKNLPEKKLIIGDCKRSDIDSTSEAYAKAMFEYWDFDACTIAVSYTHLTLPTNREV